MTGIPRVQRREAVLGGARPGYEQALAVAVVQGQDEFLGLKLGRKGRVLYIDEENPEDVVRQRLAKLGLTSADWEGLYYVWYGGVRLDTEPDKFFDAVSEWQPEVVFLDSFSRLQTGGENDVDEMNRVFNDAIYPVARKLGVPVIALHHANKQGGVRGSTAIRNAADLSLKVEADESILDQYRLSPDKPRRGQSTSITYKVIGYDANDEPGVPLDDEARLELKSLTFGSGEEAY